MRRCFLRAALSHNRTPSPTRPRGRSIALPVQSMPCENRKRKGCRCGYSGCDGISIIAVRRFSPSRGYSTLIRL